MTTCFWRRRGRSSWPWRPGDPTWPAVCCSPAFSCARRFCHGRCTPTRSALAPTKRLPGSCPPPPLWSLRPRSVPELEPAPDRRQEMRILEWRVPPYDNGTYIVYDERRDALVIDPAMGDRQVIAAAKERDLRVVEILNTHGHPDHIYGNAAVKEATRARLAIHRLDAYRLGPKRPPTEFKILPCDADDLFDEGALRYVADLEISALHTPGHTEGSTCFYVEREGVLFSG